MAFFNTVHRYFREFHSNKAKRRPLCYLPFFISRFAIGLAFFIPGNSRSKPKRHSATTTTKRKHAIILPRVVAKRVHFEQKGCPSLHQIPNKSFLTTIFTTFFSFYGRALLSWAAFIELFSSSLLGFYFYNAYFDNRRKRTIGSKIRMEESFWLKLDYCLPNEGHVVRN